MKILYTFSVDKEQEVEKKTESVNEAGNTVTIVEKVKELAPVEFCLRKPSRVMHDNADLYYHGQVSKSMSAGLLPMALISKRLSNDGGIFSEEERKEFAKKRSELETKGLELQKLVSTPEAERQPDFTEQAEKIRARMHELVREIQEFELENQSMFSSSAEYRARSKTIVWWLVALLYKRQGEGWEPFFKGDTEEARIENWNESEDDGLSDDELKFQNEVIKQASNAVTVWYHGAATNQEDFKKVLAELGKV